MRGEARKNSTAIAFHQWQVCRGWKLFVPVQAGNSFCSYRPTIILALKYDRREALVHRIEIAMAIADLR
jgi:hypothetical protein